MAESLPSLVWGARPDGACDYLSRQWVEYTGLAEDEQLGYGWFERIHPEDREQAKEQWRAALKSRTPLNMEARIRAKSGEHRWFKVRAVPIRDPRGATLRWYGTSTDIDDVQTAEARREQDVARLAATLDGISEPFLALDRELKVTFFNAAAERLFQRSRGAVVGKALWDVIPEAKGSAFESKCREAMQGHGASLFEIPFDAPPYRGRYSVRLYAHETGIALFLPRSAESSVARGSGSGDGATGGAA
jgi:PAS domain S-box-containing protein